MKNVITILAGMTCLLALPTCKAGAQTAGKYVGTTADKQGITWTIAKNATSGKLYISSLNYSLATKCQPGNSAYTTGWGLGPDSKGRSIVSGKAAYLYSFGYLYVTANLTFSGTALTGTILSLTPTFAPVASGAPRKSVFCVSPKQTFSANFTSAAAEPSGEVQAVVVAPHAQ